MDIYMVWARDALDGSVWLVDAWDDDSISSNREGWEGTLQKQRENHGADNIRVLVSSVDMDEVLASFTPQRVKMS